MDLFRGGIADGTGLTLAKVFGLFGMKIALTWL